MEVSFLDLREREIVNVYDGKKLGRIIDVVFNNTNGVVRGIIVPGNKKLFHRADDIFIPLEKIKRIGNDVILVGVQQEESFRRERPRGDYDKNMRSYENYYEYQNSRTMQNRYNERNENEQKRNRYYSKSKDVPKDNVKETISYVRLKPLSRKKYR